MSRELVSPVCGIFLHFGLPTPKSHRGKGVIYLTNKWMNKIMGCWLTLAIWPHMTSGQGWDYQQSFVCLAPGWNASSRRLCRIVGYNLTNFEFEGQPKSWRIWFTRLFQKCLWWRVVKCFFLPSDEYHYFAHTTNTDIVHNLRGVYHHCWSRGGGVCYQWGFPI